MKKENGITLVALVVMIILLMIFSTFSIYTGLNGYRLVKFEKYKAQMQAIQNGLDELYEEYQTKLNNEEIDFNVTIEDYAKEKLESDSDFQINNSWISKIGKRYGISPDSTNYYQLSIEQVKNLFNIEELDDQTLGSIIINFEKRYVFSEKPIKISTDTKTSTNSKEIYCLYELDVQQRPVSFNSMDTADTVEEGDNVKITILESNSISSLLEITLNNTNDRTIEELTSNPTNALSEIKGLGTTKVTFKILKSGEYSFEIKNSSGQRYRITKAINLYEQPLLENDLEAVDVDGTNLDANKEWKYDYNDTSIDKIQFATAIQENDNDVQYKVWIPNSLKADENILSYCNINEENTNDYNKYLEKFKNKKGIWINAIKNEDYSKYIPDDMDLNN